MTPFLEKLIGYAVTLVMLVLAYVLRDDETVRTVLLGIASAPVAATQYPRARERELEKQLRESLKPPPLPSQR